MRKNKEKSVERELPPDYPLKKYDAKTRLLAFILGLFISLSWVLQFLVFKYSISFQKFLINLFD